MAYPSVVPKWMRDDYTPDDYREDLRKALAIAVVALEKIAKPALGGKQQQQWGQEALQRIHALVNGEE